MRDFFTKKVVLICCICFWGLVTAQQMTVQDSILQNIKATDQASVKADGYNELYGLFRRSDPELAVHYLRKELALRETLDDQEELSGVYTQLAWCYIAEAEKADSAKVFLDEALKLGFKNSDTVLLAKSYTFMGYMYQRKGFYRMALDNYYRSLEYKEPLNDPDRLAFSYNLIGKTLEFQEQYDKSLDFHFKALNERRKSQKISDVALSYRNIATVYLKTKKYEKALEYYHKALDLLKRNKNKKAMAVCFNGLGHTYFEMDSIQKSKFYYERSLSISKPQKNSHQRARSYIGLAEVSIKTKDFKEASHYLQQVEEVPKVDQYRRVRREYYKTASDLYKAQGNADKALTYYKKFTALKDSMLNVASLTKQAELEGVYNMAKKEKEIATLKQQQELLEQEQRFKNMIIYGTIGTGLIILILLVYRIRNRKKIFTQKLALKEQEHEITQLKLTNEEDKSKQYLDELNHFMQLMISKNNQIRELQHQLEVMPVSEGSFNDKINELYNATILTNDDWKTFRAVFEQVHPHFISNLVKKHPATSQGDLRLAALLKLNLSNAEIGAILGISIDSVRKNKYRFRKKLDLDTDKALTELITRL